MDKTQIKILIDLALKSGEIAQKYFEQTNLNVDKKSDNSPVTLADKEISQLIHKTLEKEFPNISIICEEAKNRIVTNDKFWLIDPIDGTSEFIKKTQQFTINIALIENKTPVFGLIYAPKIPNAPLYYVNEAKELIRFDVRDNKLTKITKKTPKKIQKIITSKRCQEEDILKYVKDNFKDDIDKANLEVIKLSSSFKFCEIIEGRADLLLNQKPTMEWDTAAGHALILANGGKVISLDNKNELKYNKENFINSGFITK